MCSSSINRYYIVHFVLPVCVFGCLVFHVLYLHRVSSSGTSAWGSNNRIHLYVWLYCKDVLALVAGLVAVIVQVSHGIMVLAHVDNTMEVSILVTPLHIVPEWYFLGYYVILRSIPGVASGFLVMISYMCVCNVYGEPYSASSLVGCMGYTGRYFLVSLLSIQVFYSLWEGVQLPVGKYISYARCTILISLYYSIIWIRVSIGLWVSRDGNIYMDNIVIPEPRDDREFQEL